MYPKLASISQYEFFCDWSGDRMQVSCMPGSHSTTELLSFKSEQLFLSEALKAW